MFGIGHRNTPEPFVAECDRFIYLNKSHAAFDPRDYGAAKLGELVRRESYVEVKDVPGSTGINHLWVRLKPPARGSSR